MELKHILENKTAEQILMLLSDDKTIIEAAQKLDDGSLLWLEEEALLRGDYTIELKLFMIYHGTMDSLISSFSSSKNIEDKRSILQGLLKGQVCSFNPITKDFERYTCDVTTMPCCAGEYLKIVNRKDIKD